VYKRQALLSCNSGSENVAIGFQSLYNSTKHWNTAVGSKSLYNSVNGYGNTAIGTSALYSDISGSYNAVFGFESMKNSTGTLFNVAIGVESLKANLGDRNCAIGNYALKNNSDVSAIKNTAIGFESLNSTVVGANNTAVGYNSLFNLINGNGNLALGNMSGFNLTSGNNLILIGANVGALFGTINGQMNVGNWIYGCNGKIGIGVISQPIVTFEINGNDALKIPVGSTAERPIAPIVGMIRFNNTISKFEAYDGSIWQQL
jgi:hypothetical protein